MRCLPPIGDDQDIFRIEKADVRCIPRERLTFLTESISQPVRLGSSSGKGQYIFLPLTECIPMAVDSDFHGLQPSRLSREGVVRSIRPLYWVVKQYFVWITARNDLFHDQLSQRAGPSSGVQTSLRDSRPFGTNDLTR